ncbi:hypothetical protein MLD38_026856 [Melastoma candidum]|uniref:Uncharacterized protein n=1 Tax=Melastoma candidum TaxID=119954 RepID=A0ACB9P1S3_9MYRT|nr:hypothetical protein MLD38_026856 [Melastoma candidum]
MGSCWSSSASVAVDDSNFSTVAHINTDVFLAASTATTSTSLVGSSYVSSGTSHGLFSVASSSDEGTSPHGQILPYPNLRVFTFAELRAATKGFKQDMVLGEGGFGKVFKGWLEERPPLKSTVIAVKKLNCDGTQGFQEWMAEVNFLGRLSHPNLVKLLGYCGEERELLLVYEFMQKGSLENHLFGRGAIVQPLPWPIRMKIAIGAARGLAFLHTSEKHVIYRDFKASNILLDGSYNAKISDFGLAKIGPSESQSHITTRVMGTQGYAAPEYMATGHLYVKSDVYGFGVVLLEMLTGLRALDQNRPEGKENLADWLKPYLSDQKKLKRHMDSKLQGKYPFQTVYQLAQLASYCLASEQKLRPSMKEVVETLESLEAYSGERQVDQMARNPHRSPMAAAVTKTPPRQEERYPLPLPSPSPPHQRQITAVAHRYAVPPAK